MTEHDFITNLAILNSALAKETHDNLLFSHWFSNVSFDEIILDNGQRDYRQFIDKPGIVHVMKGMLAQKGDHAMMAIEMGLDQDPKYGDQDLEGTGEVLQNEYAKIFVNLISGVVNVKQGEMDKLRNDRMLKHFERATPALRDWFIRALNAEMISALYEGHSENVTTGIANSPNGIGVSGKYHPNMYYNPIDPSTPAGGSITAIGTEKYNKTAAEINTAINSGYANLEYISPYMLDDLSYLCEYLHIKKAVDYKGQKLYLTVISRDEINMLKQNAAFRATVERAYSGKGEKNPLISAEAYIYGDHFLLIDAMTPRPWNVTLQNFKGSGAQGYRERGVATASYYNRSLFVLGDGALGMETHPNVDLQFETEKYNFKQQQEVAGFCIKGIARKEYVSEDDESSYYATKNSSKTILSTAYEAYNNSSVQVIVKASKPY